MLNVHKQPLESQGLVLGRRGKLSYRPENKALSAALGVSGLHISDAAKKADRRKLGWLRKRAFYNDSRDAGWHGHYIKPCSSRYANRDIVDIQQSLPNMLYRIDKQKNRK